MARKLKNYTVSIPYTHVFEVQAYNKAEALEEAHASEGKIVDYDDSKAEIEEV